MLKQILTDMRMHGALDRLPYAIDNIDKPEPFAACILEAERDLRHKKTIARRMTFAKFPQRKEWTELDYTHNPNIPWKNMENLLKGAFVEAKNNLCFVGHQGTGKTHALIAIGREMCRKGHAVLFTTASEIVHSLEEAQTAGTLRPLMQKLMKPALLIIDELGFVPFSNNGARLLFDVFAKRYERAAIAVSTNLTFDKWTQLFGTIELTAALLDRFTQGATIIPFTGTSFRQQKGAITYNIKLSEEQHDLKNTEKEKTET